jgi:hypothetical protein
MARVLEKGAKCHFELHSLVPFLQNRNGIIYKYKRPLYEDITLFSQFGNQRTDSKGKAIPSQAWTGP